MPSYLLVAFDGGGAFFKAGATKNGVFTKARLDAQHGLLHFAFLGIFRGVRFVLSRG